MVQITPIPSEHQRISTAVLFALLLVFVALTGCKQAERSVDERANGLHQQLMCPVCPGETIDQSTVQIAKDIRLLVKTKLEAGESDSQIRQFFVDRYGDGILASPPVSGFSLLVWAVPPTLLVAGFGVLILVLRKMHRHRSIFNGSTTILGFTPGLNINAMNQKSDHTRENRAPIDNDDPRPETSET